MRVLFTVVPDKSTFLSMVPLAWALRTAGHEVLVASQAAFADVITQAGLTAVPVGRGVDPWRVHFFHRERAQELSSGLTPPYDTAADPSGATWKGMVDGYEEMVHQGHRIDNFPMIAGLVEFARHWRPDLVIWEPLTYAGPIAAGACGAAHARLLWSLDVFGVTRERFLQLKAEQPPEERADHLAGWLDGYAGKYGFDSGEDLVTGQFTIDQLPASLSMRADLTYLPMQYLPYGGAAVIPAWLREPPRRPRIALTLGITAAESFPGHPFGLQDVLDALAGLEVEIVATIAKAEQHRVTRIPDNARLVDYVPLHALAPTCSAVINHAGPGTLLTVARHGVPQLALPWDFDEPELARRTARQGSALVAHARTSTSDDVREGVSRLLDEPAFQERAALLSEEIAALPTPNQLVPQLEKLTKEWRA